MSLVRGLALAGLFAVEVANLVVSGWWAFGEGGFSGANAATVAVLALALLWGRYAAPRASQPLTGTPRQAFIATWFAVGTAALLAQGHLWWAIGFAALVLAAKVVVATTGGDPSPPAAVQRHRSDVGQ